MSINLITGAGRNAGAIKRGFTGLVNLLGRRGTQAPKAPIATADELRGQLPLPGFTPPVAVPPAPTPSGFLAKVRAGAAEGTARRTARNAARETAGQTPAFQRLIAGIASRPGRAAVLGLPAAAVAAGTFRDVLGNMGQPDINYSQITIPSERERHLGQVQELGQTAYGMDPALQRELQIQATLNAEQAAKGYERIGRPDLAEAARQEILGEFNQIMLAGRLQQQRQLGELTSKAQAEASELSGSVPTPTEVRELAQTIASEYFGLADEDRAFYAERGYDTPEKFIQGRINGEI